MGLRRTWKFMKDLFDFRNLDQIIKEEIPKAKLRYGVTAYAAGIMIALFSYFVLIVLAIVSAMLVYDSLPEGYSTITVKPELTSGFYISSLIYFGLIMFPYLMVGSFIYQGFAFALLRLLGGKGNFKKHYFITSYIALALGTGTLGFLITLIFIFFLPCVNLFFLLVYLAATLYLVLFVQAKMMMAVHKTSFLPVFVIILITTVSSILAFIGINLLVGHFGLLPDFTATYSIEGIRGNMLNISIPETVSVNVTNNVTNTTTVTNITNATG